MPKPRLKRKETKNRKDDKDNNNRKDNKDDNDDKDNNDIRKRFRLMPKVVLKDKGGAKMRTPGPSARTNLIHF